MSTTETNNTKKSAHDIVEELLFGLDNDTVQSLAPLGLDQPFDGHPTLVHFEIGEDGTISLDLDLKVTATIPLNALLDHRGRESEREGIVRCIKQEEEEKERDFRVRHAL
jgi:hypothetical protein